MHNAYFDTDCAIQNAHYTMHNAYFDADCAIQNAHYTMRNAQKKKAARAFLFCVVH